MPIKAVKFQIIKPLNTTWDILGKTLRDLNYHTTLMCNRAIQLYWEYNNFRSQYKAEHGKYPVDKDVYGCSFRNHVYRQLRLMYPLMASNNTSQTNQFALKRWQTDIPDIRRLAKSIPSFKLGTPIQVANQNFDLRFSDDTFSVDVTLLGRESEIGRFSILLDTGDKSKRAIFQRILDRTYKQGSMQIVYNKRKKKWFCIIAYDSPVKINDLDTEKVMGIDLGIVNAVYWAFNSGHNRGKISGGEIETFRKQVEIRRRDILRTPRKDSHGRKRNMQAADTLSEKIANFRDTVNHKYSKKIVDIAIANKCGAIQMEDLTGISKDSFFLRNWTYRDLQDKIIYKAMQEGIIVKLIDPRNTSKTCSACGHLDPENREDQATFICKNPECGSSMNADHNAARNISVWSKISKEF